MNSSTFAQLSATETWCQYHKPVVILRDPKVRWPDGCPRCKEKQEEDFAKVEKRLEDLLARIATP